MTSVRVERLGARVPALSRQLIVPRSWEATVTDEPGVPGVVRLTIEYDPVLKRMVASSVAVERDGQGGEVTSLALREVRVQSAVQQSGLLAVQVVSGNTRTTAADFLRVVRQGESQVDKVRSAAVIYQVAALINLPPLKTVANALGVSQSTATRIVNQARVAGHLEPQNGSANGQATSPLKRYEQASASR